MKETKHMNKLAQSFLAFAEADSNTPDIKESLMNTVKSPVFYIVIGAIVLLIIGIYLIRRIVKPAPGQIKVVVRHGKIHKLVEEKSSSYYLVPFTDSLGAVILLNEKELSSDKLFVNNGPDALYKINYTLTYKVSNVESFFPQRESFSKDVVGKINDIVREYADNGHVLEIIKDYREHSKELVNLINTVTSTCGIQVVGFKINYIEPLGKK